MKDEERIAKLKNIVDRLPDSPGCYQYLDESGQIIYVGKAKNLKRRVSSYFRTEVDRPKTRILVSKIQDIKYIVVKTDQEAFLLENSLIKKYSPKYNVLLKDGKTYPYICVTKEEYPRIFKTRRVNRKVAFYYGPFSHIGSMYAMLEIIHKLFKPRTCNLPITSEGVELGKYKSCLEWHIHKCCAPCIACQSHEDYMQNIIAAKEILNGNTRQISKAIYQKMTELASELRFEEAEEMKRKYLLIEDYRSKSEVVSNTITNVDVFSITNDKDVAYINFLHVTNGSINQAFTFEYKKKLDETEQELLQLGIIEIRNRYESKTNEIIVPFNLDMTLEGVEFTIPVKGDKKKLLELSLLNGRQYKLDRLKQSEKLNPEQKAVRLMKEIQDTLQLPSLPYWIECFDNSNISGTDAVAGLVVFKKLKPCKTDYRKFDIKSVEGPDDYASMREVVMRRYSRLKEEDIGFPNLIITDGGKGQMSVVKEVLTTLQLDIPVAGLAKDKHHKTSELLIGDGAVGMKPESELFRLMSRIQDEVHRFAITFHRDKRSKRQVHSELDDIKGIGEKTKSALLNKFKSVSQIRQLVLNSQPSYFNSLSEVIGASKAQIIIDYFNKTAEK